MHARPRRLAREQLVAPDAAPLVHRVLVERARRARPDELDQVEAARRADLGRPFLDRQRRAAVRLEFLLPGDEDGTFGVEDQPVEVEDDASIAGGFSSRSRRSGLR